MSNMETPPMVRTSAAMPPPAPAAARQEAFWDKLMGEIYNAAPIRQGNLDEAVRRMSQELGVAKPHLYVAEEFPAMFGGKAPNLMAQLLPRKEQGTAIVMTKKLLELFNYSPHSVSVPAEIRAGIAHELGHFKQGYRYIDGCRRYPVLIGPVAAMTGLYLLDRAGEKKAAGKDEFHAALDSAVAAEVAQIRKERDDHLQAAGDDEKLKVVAESVSHTRSTAMQAGRYALAAAAGGVAGAAATRHMMIELEFDADKTAAQLTRDPHAVIGFLKKFKSYFESLPRGESRDLAKQISLGDVYRMLVDHAHPGMEERIERLLEMSKKPIAGVAEVAGKML